MSESIPLIITIVCAAVGSTWAISSHLSSIQVAIASMGERVTAVVKRVEAHEAEIIDIKKASRNPRRR